MVSPVEGLALTNMLRGEQSFAQSFVQAQQLAAGPQFELAFFNTQNALLDKLNEEVTEIQKGVNTNGATALLKVKISQIEEVGTRISAYKDTTDTKGKKIEAALEYITELEGLAAPATAAEFDQKFALLRDTLQKTPSPTYEQFGTHDRLKTTKFAALASIDAHAHNNFATQQDIDDTLAVLSSIKGDLNVSKALVDINGDIAFDLQRANSAKRLGIRSDIFEIEASAQAAATASIEQQQELYSKILTVISLAFDASQEFTNFIAQETNFDKKTPAGSILNLFS
tara:strand:- start:1609 stop:2460 length:852 start_codon:yes stop_codon:yes gene_type:complete